MYFCLFTSHLPKHSSRFIALVFPTLLQSGPCNTGVLPHVWYLEAGVGSSRKILHSFCFGYLKYSYSRTLWEHGIGNMGLSSRVLAKAARLAQIILCLFQFGENFLRLQWSCRLNLYQPQWNLRHLVHVHRPMCRHLNLAQYCTHQERFLWAFDMPFNFVIACIEGMFFFFCCLVVIFFRLWGKVNNWGTLSCVWCHIRTSDAIFHVQLAIEAGKIS